MNLCKCPLDATRVVGRCARCGGIYTLELRATARRLRDKALDELAAMGQADGPHEPLSEQQAEWIRQQEHRHDQ